MEDYAEVVDTMRRLGWVAWYIPQCEHDDGYSHPVGRYLDDDGRIRFNFCEDRVRHAE